MADRRPPQKPSAAFTSAVKNVRLPWEGSDAAAKPAPVDYQHVTVDSPRKDASGTFASGSPRFKKDEARSPGAAAYSPRAHELSQRSLGGSSRAGGTSQFASHSARELQITDQPQSPFRLGPGEHQPEVVARSPRKSASGTFASGSPRFKKDEARSPGAAAYSPRAHELSQRSLGGSSRAGGTSQFASHSARELQITDQPQSPFRLGPGEHQPEVVARSPRKSASGTFASGSPRFKKDEARSPGAAAYSPRAHELSQRSLGGSSRAGGTSQFASHSARELQITDQPQSPFRLGPGEHQPEVVARSPRKSASGTFASGSPRFKKDEARSPGAAAYSPRAHELSQRSLGGSSRAGGTSQFASHSARELQITDQPQSPFRLGPGYYDAHVARSLSKSASETMGRTTSIFSSRSERFRKKGPSSPGPAAYSPRHRDDHSVTHMYSNKAPF